MILGQLGVAFNDVADGMSIDGIASEGEEQAVGVTVTGQLTGHGHGRVIPRKKAELIILDRLAVDFTHVGDALPGEITEEHGKRTCRLLVVVGEQRRIFNASRKAARCCSRSCAMGVSVVIEDLPLIRI